MQRTNNHALKLERLPITKPQGDEIIKLLREFAGDLGYSDDRIGDLECRSRDGFIAHSHNHGGIECGAFRDQYHAYFEPTGFENADAKINEYYDYDLELYKDEHGIPKDQDLTDEQLEDFETRYRAEDSQATVLFSMDIMHTGIDDEGVQSINLRLCVCVKDAPYHRQYDDIIDIDIEFHSAGDLVSKLETLKSDSQIKMFSENLKEAY